MAGKAGKIVPLRGTADWKQRSEERREVGLSAACFLSSFASRAAVNSLRDRWRLFNPRWHISAFARYLGTAQLRFG
ncbi:hypothetical protein NDU88_003102 [Pleurodeles waltl]|uniref:Uncharacterized protein n=1 Tax=Pleurodeles waltl TaxID=8319 RepID=A0AAV7UZ73_PLEWA|nr:hypothetical protein NDU88_003102 [Pleurodeles waltl]